MASNCRRKKSKHSS